MVTITLLYPIFNLLAPGQDPAADEEKFALLHGFLGLDGEDRFLRIAGFLVLFSFFKGCFLYMAEFSMSYAGQNVVAGLRKQLYRHLLRQSMAFYTGSSTGQIMSRVVTDTERLQETVSKTLTDFLRQIFLLLFFLGLILYTDWRLSLLAFLVAPLVLWITLHLGRRIRRVSYSSQQNLADISHALQETISGQKVVKAFGMEEYENRRFQRLIDSLVGLNLKIARISALSSPLLEFIGYVSFVPFLLYAHFQINQGLTLGAFVVFLTALLRLYEPIRKLSRMHLYFQQAFASSQRIFSLLDTHIEVQEEPGARALSPLKRGIAFRNVCFTYSDRQESAVLSEINLTISKGEIVALVGSSGSGKTSMVNLIPRFYDPWRGRVEIDGQDIREVTLESLRAQIAIVTQDTFLFDDTVRNNLAYGRQHCSLHEVVEAARAALIHDFIESLPEGYETLIGERGQRLSGGQKQRFAIARAILKKAPILILDEATSALDSESERLVQKALENLMLHCTTVVIAHRLSTVRMAHRIVVLDAGRIAEIGDHETLMARSGLYRRLYELQFADLPLERVSG